MEAPIMASVHTPTPGSPSALNFEFPPMPGSPSTIANTSNEHLQPPTESTPPSENIAPAEPLQDLGVPPSSEYDSLDDLINSLNAFGRQAGYAVCQRSTNRGYNAYADRIVRGTIVCQKSGKHRENHKYLKESGRLRTSQAYTRKSECPFKLKMTLNKATDRFKYEIECGLHNHGYIDPSQFPVHRRVDDDTMDFIRNAYRSGQRTTSLLHDLLARDPNILVTPRDLENIRAVVAKEDKAREVAALAAASHPPTQALLKTLEEKGNMPYRHWVNERNELAGLVVSDPMAMGLARFYGQALTMDTVEIPSVSVGPVEGGAKVDRFVHIATSSGTEQNFTVAIYMVKNFSDPTAHLYAMRSLQTLMEDLPTVAVLTDDDEAGSHIRKACDMVFPAWQQIIDTTKVNKTVMARCQSGGLGGKTLTGLMEDWKRIVGSTMEEQYEAQVAHFKTRWSISDDGRGNDINPVTKYCLSRLDAEKHRFVRYLVDQIPHFGITTLARGDNMRGPMKKELAAGPSKPEMTGATAEVVPSGEEELFQTISVVNKYNQVAIRNVLFQMGKDGNYNPGVTSTTAFTKLRSRISKHAFQKVLHEWQLAESNAISTQSVTCTDAVHANLGIPCSHMLRPLVGLETPIPLEWIHKHWHLATRQAIEGAAKEYTDGWLVNIPPRLADPVTASALALNDVDAGSEAGHSKSASPRLIGGEGDSERVTSELQNNGKENENETENENALAGPSDGPGTAAAHNATLQAGLSKRRVSKHPTGIRMPKIVGGPSAAAYQSLDPISNAAATLISSVRSTPNVRQPRQSKAKATSTPKTTPSSRKRGRPPAGLEAAEKAVIEALAHAHGQGQIDHPVMLTEERNIQPGNMQHAMDASLFDTGSPPSSAASRPSPAKRPRTSGSRTKSSNGLTHHNGEMSNGDSSSRPLSVPPPQAYQRYPTYQPGPGGYPPNMHLAPMRHMSGDPRSLMVHQQNGDTAHQMTNGRGAQYPMASQYGMMTPQQSMDFANHGMPFMDPTYDHGYATTAWGGQ